MKTSELKASARLAHVDLVGHSSNHAFRDCINRIRIFYDVN